MLGKALGVVTVADGSGPEFDIGELTTWPNDAVLLAPGMLLHPRTVWQATGDDSFRVAVTDAGRTVSAEVFLDEAGRPRDFRTEDRWADLPGGPVRAPWSTPVAGWTVVDGRPRLIGGAAVWHLPDGEYTYGEMELVDLRSEEHTSELQSRQYLVCRLLLEKKTNKIITSSTKHYSFHISYTYLASSSSDSTDNVSSCILTHQSMLSVLLIWTLTDTITQ